MSQASNAFAAFISYAKADAKRAEEIAACLEERGFACWIAPRNVRPGKSYGDEIIRGIERARCLILVLSHASNESAFVAREIERAVSKRKPVFPIRIENVEPSPSLELFISGTQWIDAFSGRLGPHIDRLASLLADEESHEPAALDAATRRTASRWRSPWVFGASMAAALAVVAFGAILLLRPGGDARFDYQACLNLSGDDAIMACDQAIASGQFAGPDAATLYATRGYQRQIKNDLKGALADYGEAIVLDPKIVMAFNNRGNIYRDIGEYDQAIADYDRALELDPNRPDPLASRGWIYHQRGELDRARRDFKRALALNPDDALKQKLQTALAGVEKSDPDYYACETASGSAAIAACTRAIESGKFSGGNLAYLYNDRGYLRMINGSLDQGLADFDRAIQLDPNNYYPYWNRAEILRHRGDGEGARADYQKALVLGPKEEDKRKIEASLSALTAEAKVADPEVISDPSVFSGVGSGETAASTSVGPGPDLGPPPPPPVMPASPAEPPPGFGANPAGPR